MRRVRLLVVVAATALLVVTGWSTAGTGASWVDSADLDGGVVRSGELSLLTGDAVTQVSAYRFDQLQAGRLRPGHHGQAPLVLANAGSVPLRHVLAGATASEPRLGAALRLVLTPVPTTGACPTGPDAAAPAGTPLVDAPLGSAAPSAPRVLAPGAREVVCVRVSLAAQAPSTLQALTSTVVLTFRAEVA